MTAGTLGSGPAIVVHPGPTGSIAKTASGPPGSILTMTENASTVLREALALPADERAQVAADLIASIDEERDDDTAVVAAWAQELERRAQQILRDRSSGEDWVTARERIAGRLTGR